MPRNDREGGRYQRSEGGPGLCGLISLAGIHIRVAVGCSDASGCTLLERMDPVGARVWPSWSGPRGPGMNKQFFQQVCTVE